MGRTSRIRTPHRMTVRGVCRDCKSDQTVDRVAFFRASAPRCESCGGMLDETKRRPTTPYARVNPSSEVPYPSRPSEFEIQAYLYRKLGDLGLDVRGEVCSGDGGCRFDLVVFGRHRRVARIIEVKKESPAKASVSACVPKERIRKSRRKQIRNYERFGVPVALVCGMNGANRLLASIKRELDEMKNSGADEGQPSPSGSGDCFQGGFAPRDQETLPGDAGSETACTPAGGA